MANREVVVEDERSMSVCLRCGQRGVVDGGRAPAPPSPLFTGDLNVSLSSSSPLSQASYSIQLISYYGDELWESCTIVYKNQISLDT